MLNLMKLLTKLCNEKLSRSYFVPESVNSGAQSIGANAGVSGTVALSKAGYYPLAVIGWNTSSSWCVLTASYISAATVGSGKWNYIARNTTGTANSGTVYATILWVKAA